MGQEVGGEQTPRGDGGWAGRGGEGGNHLPIRPYGWKARRSVSTESSASSRKSSSRIMPSPPRKRPRPPDPSLSSKRRRITGYLHGPGLSPAGPAPAPPGPTAQPRRTPRPTPSRHLLSRISGSVMRVLVMWLCTPLRPCQPGPAPAPPATVS